SRFFSADLPAVLLSCSGYSRKLCRRASAATDGNRARLPKAGSAGLVVCGHRTGQGLSDPVPPRGNRTVLGWTSLRRRSLLPCLRYWSSYFQCLVPGTGGPHRSTVRWPIYGAVVEQNTFVEQAGSIDNGMYSRASRCLVFSLCRIRAKERYSCKSKNSIRRENAISER